MAGMKKATKEKIKTPLSLVAKSAGALILAVLLLILLFYIAYLAWDILFYLIFGLFLIGFAYQSLARERGMALNRDSDPRIFSMVSEVAGRMGISAPDKIIMTADSGIGVAGILDKRLLLGVATLDSMSSAELYSILFHEFAHIKGLDNIIGSSLMRTHGALRTIIGIVSGLTIFGLILGMILMVFDTIYSVIILIYSRQREFLADYMASEYVGGSNFARALENYSRSADQFGIKVNPVIRYYSSQNVTLKNIYEATRKSNINFDDQTRKRIEEGIKRNRETTSIFSTHPAMNTRLEKISGIKPMPGSLPEGSCAGLFSNLNGKEEELTKIVYGMMMPRRPAPSTPKPQ